MALIPNEEKGRKNLRGAKIETTRNRTKKMEENQLIIHERQEQPVQVFDNMKGYFWEF